MQKLREKWFNQENDGSLENEEIEEAFALGLPEVITLIMALVSGIIISSVIVLLELSLDLIIKFKFF